jgi:hypothetical protein
MTILCVAFWATFLLVLVEHVSKQCLLYAVGCATVYVVTSHIDHNLSFHLIIWKLYLQCHMCNSSHTSHRCHTRHHCHMTIPLVICHLIGSLQQLLDSVYMEFYILKRSFSLGMNLLRFSSRGRNDQGTK